jgi:predicted ArsR family transcriptional regulator
MASYGSRCEQVSAHAATFLDMDREPATSSELPSATGGSSPRGVVEAVAVSSHGGGDRAHVPVNPFEHGTDAQMIERRVRTVTPLVTPTPGPGASSNLRREVLYALRTGGPAAPDQVADLVGASRTGVLQQLRTLESAGLVTRSLSRHGVGRPRHVYDLTPAAQELFPANYGALAQSILTAIRSIGGEALIRDVFEARREHLKARIGGRVAERLPMGASLWDRVREVASYQDETGYLGRATRDQDGTIWLSEHNCAISGVSNPFPIACEEELQLFGEILGAKVTRECHIASGGRSCTYRVAPLDK